MVDYVSYMRAIVFFTVFIKHQKYMLLFYA